MLLELINIVVIGYHTQFCVYIHLYNNANWRDVFGFIGAHGQFSWI